MLIEGAECLVTGATGFIGFALVKKLKSLGGIVREIGRVTKKDINGHLLSDVDFIFHLAAQTDLDIAEKDPVVDYEANILPLVRMLNKCKETNVHPKFIFSGTITQVGISTFQEEIDENVKSFPSTTYDLHKWICEKYLAYYVRRGIVTGTTLRLSNVYGPGASSKNLSRGFLNRIIKQATQGDFAISGDGEEKRDFLYIDDAIEALVSAAMTYYAQAYFVVGSGSGISFKEAIYLIREEVEKRTNKPILIRFKAGRIVRPIDSRMYHAYSNLFKRITGWEPKTSLRAGIRRTIDSFLD